MNCSEFKTVASKNTTEIDKSKKPRQSQQLFGSSEDSLQGSLWRRGNWHSKQKKLR